jgi:hypothetical protein
MATVNKDFKIKSGLIVEGTTATVNGYDILTKKTDDQNYIIGLIGGSATSDATPDTVVLRDNAGSFSAHEITADAFYGDLDGQAATVDSLSGHTTTEISEGTNQYFTNQRALDATSAAYDAAGAATTAQGNAEDYADTVSGTAEQNAKNYADGLAGNYDPAGSASTAEGNANDYTDSAITALNLSGTYDALGAATTALNDAKAYTDQEVAALVDSAPALLDTLNELAAAIADNPNYATDVANLIADKADTSYVNQEISDLDTAAQGYASAADTSARGYADGLISTEVSDRNSAISTAITNLDLANTYDALGAATTAQNNAATYTDNAINALSTSDIEEGTNEYFTDSRAKSSAADLLTGATLTNITITGTGAGLTITAENGVADSDTDDLTEGTSNLYFTNTRALDAVDNSYITPASVSINNYRKEEATQQYVASAGTVDVHSIGYPYESAKYLVRVVGWVSGVKHSQMSEILMTVDGNDNIAITEYGTIHTSDSPLASFSARLDQSGSTRYVLTATTAVSGCEVIAAATMLSWAD